MSTPPQSAGDAHAQRYVLWEIEIEDSAAMEGRPASEFRIYKRKKQENIWLTIDIVMV